MVRFEVPEGWCVQAFRFTLDPTEEQARSLARHFGARRKAFNWTVAALKAEEERLAREAAEAFERRDLTEPEAKVLAHGGRLATDAPDSPHWLIPKMKARIYIAGAIDDQSFPDDMKARLAAALTDARADFKLETYPAKHGFVFRDHPAYDAAASERHWHSLLALLDSKLKQ